MQQTVTFPSGRVSYFFGGTFDDLWTHHDPSRVVLVTNEQVAHLYPHHFSGKKTLIMPVGEQGKDMNTITTLARDLLQQGASRATMLIGVGGGVVTDVTGFLASIFMRGIQFGFVPTTLLGMVDAAIGGKNGVNLGLYKNTLGTISQPQFVLYDTRFLDTLPDDEWSNGFAEIIKYACIFDPALFAELQEHNISFYRDHDDDALQSVIQRCVAWKNKIVAEDEQEKSVRKLLNFGHTAAHAIENLYEIPHGKAVGIGMVIACMISAQMAGLDRSVTEDVKKLLSQYHLPVRTRLDARKAMEVLKMDKKRQDDTIDYILLEDIGKAVVKSLPLDVIEKALIAYEGED